MTDTANSAMLDSPGGKNLVDYEVKVCLPTDLSAAELGICIAIIQNGDAVNLESVKRELPNATSLALALCKGQIVGVGAVKRLRTAYAKSIIRKSGADFPPETLELGYVAVDPAHRMRGLSHRIVQLLLSEREDRLFATTSTPAMKRVLTRVGFAQRGNEWLGTHSQLSCWVRE